MNQASDLNGRIAVVTGGSGVIGQAIARALQAAGAYVSLLDVATPKGLALPWIECDVRDDSSVAHAVSEVTSKQGGVDIAVHAAGVSRDAVVWKLSLDDWDFVQSVNLRGAFLLIRHSLPRMRVRRGGRIVLIGSINGSRGKFGTSAYSASKAGLLGLAKTVAREAGRFGVLINVIEPGWVRTPLTDSVPQPIRDAALAESLVGTFVEPEDIGHAVTFLCGPGGGHITGQVLRVDGGQFLGPT
ncbi:MAG TPA: SDR family NAD(P)-dependent oxidoreductase [Candidatus Acidoferrales bacterium]|nr:SDR family NAD(P)-dependent oxidoreductase [Candidatus Acidoferrales bacterium]HXY48984.1 SDR family NAD(P)-dependent oxidoreductase [Terriglobales bacterium]